MNKLTNKLPFITTKWFDIDVGLFYPELLYDKTIEVLSISFIIFKIYISIPKKSKSTFNGSRYNYDFNKLLYGFYVSANPTKILIFIWGNKYKNFIL